MHMNQHGRCPETQREHGSGHFETKLEMVVRTGDTVYIHCRH
jgi:hypothetical protein